MTRPFRPPILRSRRTLIPFAAALLLLLAAGPARADMILSLQSVAAAAGSSGDALDVTLTNTGPSPVAVGGFSFEVSTPTANIDFTAATTATSLAPYIFDGQSLFGPDLATGTGQALDASDEFAVLGSGATLASGATVGLGHLLFDVAPGTPTGPITVSFTAFPATSLTDPSGAVNIPIAALNAGTITVTTAAGVPEPSSTLMGSLIGLGGLGYWWRRRKATTA